MNMVSIWRSLTSWLNLWHRHGQSLKVVDCLTQPLIWTWSVLEDHWLPDSTFDMDMDSLWRSLTAWLNLWYGHGQFLKIIDCLTQPLTWTWSVLEGCWLPDSTFDMDKVSPWRSLTAWLNFWYGHGQSLKVIDCLTQPLIWTWSVLEGHWLPDSTFDMYMVTCSVHKNHRTCRTFPMARPKCLMRDFTNLNRINKAHWRNVWWTMKVFHEHCTWRSLTAWLNLWYVHGHLKVIDCLTQPLICTWSLEGHWLPDSTFYMDIIL